MNANIKNDNGFHMKLFHEIIIAQKFHIDRHQRYCNGKKNDVRIINGNFLFFTFTDFEISKCSSQFSISRNLLSEQVR